MSLRPRTQVRQKRCKVASDVEDGRRRRDHSVEIRKNKKRRIVPSSQPLTSKKLEILPSMVAGVYSDDSNMQLEATTQFRKFLSIGNPAIEEVIRSGVVPRFVEFLTRKDFPQLQREAGWVLEDMACGTYENTKFVLHHVAVPFSLEILANSRRDHERENAVWSLGFAAGDTPESRDLVLSKGAWIPLLSEMNAHAKVSMLRKATRTLSNICSIKPYPPFELTKQALPALERLVHSNDDEVLANTCWALSYLSDGTNDKIQQVIEAGVCQRLVELLQHPSPSVIFPALRSVGNIAAGGDQTQCIIEHGALPCLLNLLTDNHKKNIKKEACWTISIINSGNNQHRQAVIEAGLIDPLLNLIQTAEFEVKKEAACAITKATSGGTNEQIMYLVNQGCIKSLCDLLLCFDPTVNTVCLEGLENILKVGEVEKNLGRWGGVNYHAQLVDDERGLEKIEILLSHRNNEIYEKAVRIIETYWSEEEGDEPEGDAAAQPEFKFGGSYIQVPFGGFSFNN